MATTSIHPLLTKGISEGYISGLEKLHKLPGCKLISEKKTEHGINANMVSVSAKDVLQNRDYFNEIFGPSTIAVLADNLEEMIQLTEIMPGQLTATIHATENDYGAAKELIENLTHKVGRIVLNGFPTGVEVCHAMVHGGPYPATTDSRVTSVGTTSIYRFTRPVCYQNLPVPLLSAIPY